MFGSFSLKPFYLQKMPADMSSLGARMMIHLYGDVRIFIPAFVPNVGSDDLASVEEDIPIAVIRTLYAIELIVLAISLPIAMLHNYCLARSMFFHPNLTRIVQVGNICTANIKLWLEDSPLVMPSLIAGDSWLLRDVGLIFDPEIEQNIREFQEIDAFFLCIWMHAQICSWVPPPYERTTHG